MVAELVLYRDGERCATVEHTATGNVTFVYDEQYRSRPGANLCWGGYTCTQS
jgi:hypothetical protein